MSLSATRPLFSHSVPPSKAAWLARQFRDPYVRERAGRFRSRSAFKLLELDQKWKFFHPRVRAVVDLGAAPGGWSQVVAAKMGWTEEDVVGLPRIAKRKEDAWSMDDNPNFGLRGDPDVEVVSWSGPDFESQEAQTDPSDDLDSVERPGKAGRGTIVAIDLLRMLPIPGVKTIQMDFLSPQADAYITSLAETPDNPGGKIDVILSDMAANFSGNKTHDIESSLDLCHAVITFARRHLQNADETGRRKGGVLVLKYFEHPLMAKFRHEELKPWFRGVYNSKPDASRAESSEGYWICMGFRDSPLPKPQKSNRKLKIIKQKDVAVQDPGPEQNKPDEHPSS